jgi:hypothetical protein
VVSDVLRVADGIVGHSSLRLLCALSLQDCGMIALKESHVIDALDVRLASASRLADDEVECALLVSSLVALRCIGGVELALRWLAKFWQVTSGHLHLRAFNSVLLHNRLFKLDFASS